MMTVAETQENPQIGTSTSGVTSKLDKLLYNQCYILRRRLLHIRGFAQYFSNDSTDAKVLEATDPVDQLWDVFYTGIPLCYLFNQLPVEAGFDHIKQPFSDQKSYQENPDRVRKRAIALFAVNIRADRFRQKFPSVEPFTVTTMDHYSTDGFMKVIQTISIIVNHLAPSAFLESPAPSPVPGDTIPVLTMASPSKDTLLANIVREITETERNYVCNIEKMLIFSNALSQANIMDPNLLFRGITKLAESQRRFLSLVDGTAKLEFHEQRWGRCFLESEEEFTDSYETYCANYPGAKKQLLINEQNLAIFDHLIKKSELPCMLARPVSRICKYSLLLESLLKAYSRSDYPHYDELKRGLAASKRVVDKVNEALRRSENEQVAMDLSSRVQDWKGFHPTDFGALLLDDCMVVTSSDISQEYYADDDFCVVSKADFCQSFHVFLFEEIIILCEEEKHPVEIQTAPIRKPPPSSRFGTSQKSIPLLLKGHIFLRDVTRAIPTSLSRTSSRLAFSSQNEYSLAVWWKCDAEQNESFTLRFRNENQMHQWQARLNTLLQGLQREAGNKENDMASARRSQLGASPSTLMAHIYSYIAPKVAEQPPLRSHLSFPCLHSESEQPNSSNATALTRGNADKLDPKIVPNSMTSSSNDKSINRSSQPSEATGHHDSLLSFSSGVKVKVYFQEDIFMLQIAQTTAYEDLVAKIGRKVSLCGPRREHGPLRMRYRDEDGDLVSLRSTEDMQMFFEQDQCHSGQPIVLLVT